MVDIVKSYGNFLNFKLCVGFKRVKFFLRVGFYNLCVFDCRRGFFLFFMKYKVKGIFVGFE